MKAKRVMAILVMALFVVFLASGNTVSALAIDTVTLPTEVYGEDVISVALPAINDEGISPFDFIIDPEGLIYETDAAKYGGGSVEEGATLLFRNHEGDYDFSQYSDRLTVRNQSNIPVIVTITASVDDLGEIEMVGSPDFDEDESCSMYLALVDDEGNEKAVFEKGEASVSIEMRKAPDNAYVYRIDEETDSYSYELVSSADEIDFDTYSFGLKGYCNPNGDWQDISVHPYVRVTWRVEPVLSEDVVDEEEEESVEDIDADSSTDIDTTGTVATDDKDAVISDGDKQVSQDEEPSSEDADDGNPEDKPDGDIEQSAQDSSGENEDSSKTSEDSEESGKDAEDAEGNAIKTSDVNTSGEAETENKGTDA